ncbi:MAG: hypothetical protein IT545_11055 [Rhodobacteraceae bacterium]|nr:hypothetical protein [Paracoccaceae bacterium]
MSPLARTLLLVATALAAAATPALAQTRQLAEPAQTAPEATGTCGQPLAATHVLRQPLDRVAAEPFEATLRFHGPAWLEFTLAETARTVLRTEARGEDDPVLLLFDRGGAIISDDDGGGNVDALVDMSLAAGTYCAQVRLFGSGIVPEAVVPVLLATGAEAEALAVVAAGSGDAPACADPALTTDAGPVAPGMGELALSLMLAPSSHSDVSFTTGETMELEFGARSTEFDTQLTLFGPGGELASDDDGAGGTDSRIVTSLEPGQYCLRVTSYDGDGGPFDLRLSDEPTTPAGTFCADPTITADFPAEVAPGMGTIAADGTIGAGGASDWRLRVLTTALYQIDARSDALDTMIELRDAADSYVDGNDDGPDGLNSRLVRELAAGDYCLRVTGYGGATGAFSLVLTDSPGDTPPATADACADPTMTEPLGRLVGPGLGILKVPGTLAPGARQDWTLSVEGAVTVQFDAASADFDTVLELWHAGGGRLAESDDDPDAGGTNSRLVEALAPGDYCLSLRSWDDSGTGAYEVALTEQDPATLRRAAIEAGEMIPEAGSGVDVEALGTLATTLQTQRLSQTRTKWLAFEVGEPGLVQVIASSLVGDFTLRLYDGAGVRLGESRSAGMPRTAALYREMPAGRFVVAMTADPGAAGRLDLRQVTLTRFVRP